jgi:hypothetical protein
MQTTMPRVRFEPTIPMFERAKTVHALDHEATVFGYLRHYISLFFNSTGFTIFLQPSELFWYVTLCNLV